jgi:broad specificity phosphatase PhoE
VSTTVFLVRHGSTGHLGKRISGRLDGVPLNEAGCGEAEAVARRLRDERLDAVYTSPLQRTRETAAPIAQACAVEPVVDEDLLEIDFGGWTGKTFIELDQDPAWTRWNAARESARAPGGEDMSEVQARLRRFLEHARRRHSDGRIAAVTHADVIKAVLAEVLGFSLDRHDRLEVNPGSVTALVTGDWGTKVLSVNEGPR